MQNYFITKISKKQLVDAGLAILLILVLSAQFTGNILYYKFMLPIVLATMIYPKILYPFAVLWFSLAKILGTIVSKIILTLVFFLVVFPMGAIRKVMGKDSLQLNEFKKSNKSVFKTRNYIFLSKDLEKPF